MALTVLGAGAVPAIAADTVAPAAVRGMVTSADKSRVKLDWTNNTEKDLAGYLVYRADAADGNYTKLTASPRRGSDYPDYTARPGFTSFYKVTAVDKSGNESTPVSVSSTRRDGAAPAAPATLTATRDASGITLDWADNAEADLAGYVVSRATTSGGKYTNLNRVPVGGSTFVDAGAAPGTNYYYRVTAVDFGGNVSKTAALAVPVPDVTAPAAVARITAVAGSTGIKLDWASNSEKDLAGYLVYRAADPAGEYTRLTPAPRTSSDFTDGTAPLGVMSYYKVVAVDKTGNESPAVAAASLRRDSTAPLAPKTLAATGSATGVGLDWADNTEADLAGYLVSRATIAGGSYTPLTLAPVPASGFEDTTAAEGTVYFYRVSAVDSSGNVSAAVSASAARLDLTAPGAVSGLAASGTAGSVSLSWTAGTDSDLAGYHVYRWAQDADQATAVRLTTAALAEASFSDTAVPDDGTYSYAVTAVDRSGNESAASAAVSAAVTDTTPPAQPAGLAATGTTAGVGLDWADNTEADLAGYLVSRSDSADGTFTPLTPAPVPVSAFEDTAAPAGTESFYRVTAVDRSGNESGSAAAQASAVLEKTPVAGADVTVAQDGTGDYTTIAAALAAAPANAQTPFVIGVKPGTYRELLVVGRPNVTLLGATGTAADVVITYDNAAGTPKPDGTGTYGTSGSATVLIKANNVTTKNLTIENSYRETGTGSEQAVALKTSGDRLVFDNVRLLGDQDTLYVDSPAAGATARSYFTNSYVEGDVDFIFGRGTAVFDKSTLMASTRGSSSNNGYVTAASTDKSLTYGYLITDSTILSDAPAGTFALGRPWQPSSDPNAIAQVVIRDTELPAAIKATAWTDMSGFSWRNARFFEYNNSGPGAAVTADRPQLTALEAAKYTKWAYLAGTDGWNPTGQTPPPPPADATAPAAPAAVTAVPGDSSVTLAWDANGEDDVAGYHVYRAAGAAATATAANRLTAELLTAPAFTDRTAANGNGYAYVVTAVDRAGNESPVSATVPAAPVGVPLPAHDILVAPDGSGRFTSVQAAVDAAAAGTAAKPTVIAVKPGVYRELVNVSKNYVKIIGTTGNPRDVVFSYDNAALTINPATGTAYGTGGSQTMLVKGSNVTVKDVTVENAYKEVKINGEQAVALKTTGDRLVFDNVRLLGNQDTLLVDSPDAPVVARSYFVNSYIEGDVDFIFGRGTAVFQNSTIHALSRGSASNNGYITAASTSDHNPFGFLIVDSTITSNAPAGTFSLGRPWRGWSDGYTKNGIVYNSRGQVTIRNTELPAAVRTGQPWADMSPNLWTDGRFGEYANTGVGAGINPNRPQLTDEQAADATPQRYLAGSDGWNPAVR